MILSWKDYSATKAGVRLLDVPTLDITGPGLVLLLGASGSGKTTLLRSATGLLGALHVVEESGTATSQAKVAYLPQDAQDAFLAVDPRGEFQLRLRAAGRTHMGASKEADHRLSTIGFSDRATSPFDTLSAGERRRLALAAVQATGPDVLLLDEPFNHLDDEWKARFTPALLEAAANRLVVAATHDPVDLLPHARQAIVMEGGKVVFDGPPQSLQDRATEFPALRLEPTTVAPDQSSGERRDPIVVAERLTLTQGARVLFSAAGFHLNSGLHVLQGANGSGKTTLLKALAGFHHPAAGRLQVAGQDPTRVDPAALSATVLLHAEEPLDAVFAASVADEVAFAPTNHGIIACDVTARTREALWDFDLEEKASRSPFTLSGGERERLLLACASAARPRVLLLDEPAQGLDRPGRDRLLAFVRRLRKDTCIVMATHDEELALHADSLLRIANGTLSHDDPQEVYASIPS